MDFMKPEFKRFLLPCLLGLALFLAGCSGASIALDSASGIQIFKRLDQPPVSKPPAPAFQGFNQADYEAALGKLEVRFIFFLSLTTPRTLFLKSQTKNIARVLTKEIPRLKKNEAIEFKMKDGKNNYPLEVLAWAQGEELFLDFLSLSLHPEEMPTGNRLDRNQAKIQIKPGVRKETRSNSILVALAMTGKAATKGNEQTQLKAISQALKEKIITSQEASQLKNLAQKAKGTPGTWLKYFQKRTLLEKSFKADLFTAAEYQSRKKSLINELQK